jgi:predicted XRE-type DNA-binding protein
MSKARTFTSVWDAIADTPAEAANLRVRAQLMSKIAAMIEESEWTQAEAAKRCLVTQPRINDLLRGRISRFSIDALVNIASALGRQVRVELASTDAGHTRRASTPNPKSLRQVAGGRPPRG